MQKRDNYISGHLVDIRDRLKVHARESGENDTLKQGETDPSVPVIPAVKSALSIDVSAVKRRTAEALRSRSELSELIAAAAASAEQRLKAAAEEKKELDEAAEKLAGIPDAPADDSPAGAGSYFRQVESVRLDYIRTRARYHAEGAEPQTGKGGGDGFPNYFGGQIRAGIAFNMITAIAVIIAAFIIGGMFYSAINGGF